MGWVTVNYSILSEICLIKIQRKGITLPEEAKAFSRDNNNYSIILLSMGDMDISTHPSYDSDGLTLATEVNR